MLSVSLVLLAFLAAAGCTNKGPVPNDEAAPGSASPKVVSTETGGAHPGQANPNPHAGVNDPHAGMDMGKTQAPASNYGTPDSSGMIDVGSIAFKMPDKWNVQTPKSSMRRAQLAAPGSAGVAELVVFYFGPQGAGSTSDNIDRWIGQFTKPDGSPVTDAKQTSDTVNGLKLTKVDVAGQFTSGMGPGGQPENAKPGSGMLGAIVEAPDGPYYFKLIGPGATVAENRATFDELLSSLISAPQ